MSTIRKSDFVKGFEGKSLDVKDAKANAALAGLDVAKADLDGDGKISAREAGALFKEIDKFDRNGSVNSIAKTDAQGQLTKAGGLADAVTAALKADAVAPTPPAPAGANPAAVGKAAKELVEKKAENYGVAQPWVNTDPNHAAPTGKPLHFLEGRWKCNLFGGNAMANAGFEPPYYGNKGHGEYPNANQFYKFSDKYAAKFGNKVHFNMVEEARVQDMTPEAARAAVTEMLKKAQPGDLLMVDHPGSGVTDGGHTRVVTANNFAANGTVDFAQASYDKAQIKAETVNSFTGEEHVWLLRPNRPRAANVQN